jgi:hypothetical protein
VCYIEFVPADTSVGANLISLNARVGAAFLLKKLRSGPIC